MAAMTSRRFTSTPKTAPSKPTFGDLGREGGDAITIPSFHAFDGRILSAITNDSCFNKVASNLWNDVAFLPTMQELLQYEFRWNDLVHIIIFSHDLPTRPMRQNYCTLEATHYHILTIHSEDALSSLMLGYNTDVLSPYGRSHSGCAQPGKLRVPDFDRATAPRLWSPKRYLEDIAGRYASAKESLAFCQLAFEGFIGGLKALIVSEEEGTLLVSAYPEANVESHASIRQIAPPSPPSTPGRDDTPQLPAFELTDDFARRLEAVRGDEDRVGEWLEQIDESPGKSEEPELEKNTGKRPRIDVSDESPLRARKIRRCSENNG